MKFQHFQSFKPQSFRGESSSASLGFNQRGNFTVYVDNLPNSVGAPWFRKFFSNFGHIGDFHIPNKRSRRTGNRFGFIRFNNRREVDVAIARANGLWIGKRNLIVERASYDRGFEKPYFEVYSGALRNNYVGNQELDPSSGDPGKFSKQVEKNITINVQPVATEWLTRSVVAKLKEITTSEMVQNAFTVLKFNKVLVRHMGGLDLIITFNSKEDRMLALNNPSVKSWFNCIKPWNGEAAGTSRLVWLKCRGMPLNVWSYHTFKRVGEIWGNFITLDVETLKEETFDVGRMLVATDNSQNIDEWINIIVRGKNYKVKVWEEVCDDFFNEKSVRDWVKSHHPGIGNQFKPAVQTHHEDIGRVDLNQEVKDKAKSDVDMEKSHSKSFDEVQQNVDDITDRGGGYGAKDVGLVKDAELEKQNTQVADDGMETSSEELVKNTDVVINNNAEENEVEMQNEVDPKEGVKLTEVNATDVATNPPKSKLSDLMLNDKSAELDALSSSFERDITRVEDGKSLESSDFNQSHFGEANPLDEASTTVIMESRDNIALGSTVPDIINEVAIENFKDASNANLKEVDLTHIEVADEDTAPIHSAVKRLQGKKKRKNIDDILGFSRVKTANTNSKGGGRNKNKCVVLRSAIAAAALSASISSEGINNRNRLLLNEAQAIWTINKMHGIGYDGDEQEVISKIANLETQDLGMADCHL